MNNSRTMKQGGIAEVFTLAFPMMISTGCETLMIFTDRLFMAKLGAEQMNAVMMGGLTVFVSTTFFIGLTGYTNALVAQYLGAGKKSYCGLVITQAVIISFLAYPLLLMISPFIRYLFNISSIDQAQLIPQNIYFNIIIFGTIFPLLRSCFSGFFSGIGKTKFVMLAAVISMVINIAANYVLIFGKWGFPALAIRGAAIGTLIGEVSGVVVLIAVYLSKKYRTEFALMRTFHYDAAAMVKLFRFGFSAGLEMFLNLVAFNLMIAIFHADGLVTATAATIMFNWDLVSFVPLIGVQIGVTSLVGRYMGSRNPDTAHKTTISGLFIGWGYSSVIFIFFVFFPNILVDIFEPHEIGSVFLQARPVAIFMIRVGAFYVMVDAVFAVLTGALRGAGDTLWAMIITSTLHWILVPILFVLLHIYNFSAKLGWVFVVSIFLSFSGLIFWRYASGNWRKIKVVE